MYYSIIYIESSVAGINLLTSRSLRLVSCERIFLWSHIITSFSTIQLKCHISAIYINSSMSICVLLPKSPDIHMISGDRMIYENFTKPVSVPRG